MNMREFSDALAKAVDAIEGKDAAEERARHLNNVADQFDNSAKKAQAAAAQAMQAADEYVEKRKAQADKIQKGLDEAHEAHKARQAAFDEQSKAQADAHGETLANLQAAISAKRDELADVTGEVEKVKATLSAAHRQFNV